MAWRRTGSDVDVTVESKAAMLLPAAPAWCPVKVPAPNGDVDDRPPAVAGDDATPVEMGGNDGAWVVAVWPIACRAVAGGGMAREEDGVTKDPSANEVVADVAAGSPTCTGMGLRASTERMRCRT